MPFGRGMGRECCCFFYHRDVLEEKEAGTEGGAVESTGKVLISLCKPTRKVFIWDPKILCIPECSCAFSRSSKGPMIQRKGVSLDSYPG